jgi:hypothetical protein
MTQAKRRGTNKDGYTPKQMAINILSLEGGSIFFDDDINYHPYTFRDKTIQQLEKLASKLVKSLATKYENKDFMDISSYYDIKVKAPYMD